MTLELSYCPSTLAEGFDSFSPSGLRELFNGRKVSHLLPYVRPEQSEAIAELFIENRKRISISGVQEKLSIILDKNKLRLTNEGEQGTYILKPIPRDLKKVDQVPANEHLTMQIAKQVYGINTAANGLVFFQDGTPAYITKRFDVKSNGEKMGKEDFATLSGKTKDTAGSDFKYESNYEEIGLLIQKFVPAWKVEIEKFYAIVVFNYLFSNGDAHLKNFSLLETSQGDHILSPAYDLLNTRLHVNDADLALKEGLFNNYETESFKANGFCAFDDFLEFGQRIGMSTKRVIKTLSKFLVRHDLVETLIQRSFFNDECKKFYISHYESRLRALNYSFLGKNE